MINTLQNKYNCYFGCMSYFDQKTGHLIISKNTLVIKLDRRSPIGMVSGVRKEQGKNWIVVTYDGISIVLFRAKYAKII